MKLLVQTAVIQGNECYNNKSLIPWMETHALSDGNGIIYDDSRNTQNGSTLGVYTGRALIANNVSYLNGGSGIHCFSSAHCDLINNTAYKNGGVVDYPDLYSQDSNDVQILNNIVYTRPGMPANRTLGNSGLSTDYNLYFNDANTPIQGSHDLRGDPSFFNLPEADSSGEVSRFDFRLRPQSPAIDAAIAFPPLVKDFFSADRIHGPSVDMGAAESDLGAPGTEFPKLINLSTRSYVGEGNTLQIGGFVTRGTASKTFLLRSIGPGLSPFGIPPSDLLNDPELSLNFVSPTPPVIGISSSDDWDPSNIMLASLTYSAGAFPLQAGSKDAATTANLTPGAYTVHAIGRAGNTGIALVEVYDTNPDQTDCELINLSTRAYLRSGNDYVIGGFVIKGNGWRRFLIRGLGAYLSNFLDKSLVLPDPALKIYQQNTDGNVLIAENDDYSVNLSLLDTASGALHLDPLPSDTKDAAVALTLEQGAYTVVLSGKASDKGLALVEIYALP